MSNYIDVDMMLPVYSSVFKQTYHLPGIPLPGDTVELLPSGTGEQDGLILFVKRRQWTHTSDIQVWFEIWYPMEDELSRLKKAGWEKVNG